MCKLTFEQLNDVEKSMYKAAQKGSAAQKGKQGFADLIALIKRNNDKLVSDYYGNKKKVIIKRVCGHDHNILPGNYKKNVQCPYCVGKNKITAEQDFFKILSENSHKLIGEYKSNTTRVYIDFGCKHEPGYVTPKQYKKFPKCLKCEGRCHDEAAKLFYDLIKKNGHKSLTEYKSAHEKVLIDYNCGHKPNWTTPNTYKRGCYCPKCAGNCSEESYKAFYESICKNGHCLLSEYVNSKTKVLIDFKCGHESHWITPNRYGQGDRCPKCSGHCPDQSRDNFFASLDEKGHDLLSEYVSNETKVLIDFKCGHDPHWITPKDYKRNQGCAICGARSRKREDEIFNYLKENTNYFIFRNQKPYDDLLSKKGRRLEYDIILSETGDVHDVKNILIEVQGEHHDRVVYYNRSDKEKMKRDERAFERRVENDKIKKEYANNIGMKFIEVWYYDDYKQILHDNGIVCID